MIEIIKIIYWIVGIANFTIAFFVLYKSKQKNIKISFFIMMMVLVSWLFVNYQSYFSGNVEIINITGKLSFFFGILVVPSFLLFVLNFPNKNFIKLRDKIIFITITVIVALMSFGDHFQKGVILNDDNTARLIRGDLYFIFSIYIFVGIIFVFVLLFKKYFNSTAIDRIKLRYTLIGFGLSALIGLISNIIVPFTNGKIISYWGSLGTIFISIAFAYSILKYRLMDIRVVIKKGLAYFVSVLILLFAYIYLLFVSKDYLVNEFGYSEQTILVVLILVIVLTFEPLRRYIIKLVDKILFSEVEEKIQTDKLRVTLTSTMQFDTLINKIEQFLNYYLEVENTNFIWLNKETGKLQNYNKSEKIVLETTGPVFQYLKNNTEILVTEEIPYLIEQMSNGERGLLVKVEKKLKDLNVYMVVPVGEPGELMGIFLLTQKKNKEAFTTDDVEYLVRLQPQMTGAIANAIFYKQAVERIGRTE